MITVIQDIPLSKLVPASCNVRRTGRSAGLEELAASIAAHGLLQNLTVRPHGANGKKKSGACFEVIAGSRRLAALQLLAKRKALAKDAPVPCHVMEDGAAEEIGLAENILQCPMHPADQYEAFAALHRDHGMNAEDIAARFGATPAIVRQRLRLGAVSPKLLQLYREEELTLDQLTAFAIADDHGLQERVWEELGWNNSRAAILAALHPQAVHADDPRAQFVGLASYEAGGGALTRDLFDEDGGFLTDPALLNQMVRDRLQPVADEMAGEGWKWVRIEPVYDHSLTAELRRVYPEAAPLSEEQQAQLDGLEARYNELAEQAEDDSSDALADEIDQLEQEIAALTGTEVFATEVIAKAGVIVSLDRTGQPRIERGLIRPEDDDRKASRKSSNGHASEGEQAGKSSDLPGNLVAELTAYRTAGLRNDLALNSDLALIVFLHALAAATFQHRGADSSCLQITPRSAYLGGLAKGIEESPAMQQIEARHAAWAKRIPSDSVALWTFIRGLEPDERAGLLAHCVSLTIDAVLPPGAHRTGKHAHADVLAQALNLDMCQYWKATPQTYLARVSKDRILDAVRDGVSPQAADNLAALKKPAMVSAAADRLADRDWLPDLLRNPVAERAAGEPLHS